MSPDPAVPSRHAAVVEDSPAPAPRLFLLEVIPLTILFSWLHINSHGSILLVVLFQFVANAAVEVLNIPGSLSLWAIYVGMNWLLAALIPARYGVSRLSRHGAGIERDLGTSQALA